MNWIEDWIENKEAFQNAPLLRWREKESVDEAEAKVYDEVKRQVDPHQFVEAPFPPSETDGKPRFVVIFQADFKELQLDCPRGEVKPWLKHGKIKSDSKDPSFTHMWLE